MRYAYIDSETRAIMTSTEIPETVSMFWTFNEDADPNQLAVNNEGELVLLTETRQYPWQEWDFSTNSWIDTRTEEEKTRVLNRARNYASMTRTDFIIACANAQILSIEDAKIAVRGDIPTALQPLIDSLPVDKQVEAEIRWTGANLIERNDPLILMFAQQLQITDEQLDMIFGITI